MSGGSLSELEFFERNPEGCHKNESMGKISVLVGISQVGYYIHISYPRLSGC